MMIKTEPIQIGNLKFDLLTCGNSTAGQPVMLLHGFPETHHMWIPLMEELSQQGYYCVAPNQRGYSNGAQPKGKKNYEIQFLTEDIFQISKLLGWKKFHLIGHDWGAVIGWQFAFIHPDVLFSWTALSVPHTRAFTEAIATDPIQQKMSAYIRRFQWRWLPEYQLRKNNYALLKKLWKHAPPQLVKDYLQVFSHTGTLSATLSYYRANYAFLNKAEHPVLPDTISVPTLFVWGENDFAIGRYGVENCGKYVSAPYTFISLNTGHWLLQTAYLEVASAIIKHLKINNN